MLSKGFWKKKKVVGMIGVYLTLLLLFPQKIITFSSQVSPAFPSSLWASFNLHPLRKISKVFQPEWHWKREDILIEKQGDRTRLWFPESKIQYTPLAPTLPYIEYSLPLQENETIAFIRVINVEWEKLPIQTNQLAKHKELFSFQDDRISMASLGIHIPDCYPEGSFAYSVGWKDTHPVLYVKLFPLHSWENYVWLTEQLQLEIGICFNNIPEREEENLQHSVIISPDELLEEAKELGMVQQKSGYNVKVVPLSHIQNWKVKMDPISLNYMVGFREVSESEIAQIPHYDFETADKMRAYLKQMLKQNQIHYLTLFGDASYIPPSEYVISTRNTDPYDKMIPTDLFYMAPEASGRNIPLRIIFGRIPVRNKEEARLYLNKNNQYRLQSSVDWRKSIALFGGDMFEDDYYGELQCSFMKNSGVFGNFSVQKFYQTDNQYNRDIIAKVMKTNPYGFMLMSSHGRGDYLRLPGGYLDSSEVMNQSSSPCFPIWVSNACLNGSWDTRLSGIRYGTDRNLPIPTSFSEALLFSKGGAIAYVGGARVNYAGMAYNSNLGEMEVFQLYNIDAMIHYFFESYHTKNQTLGEIFIQSTRRFVQYDFDNGYEYTLKTLFGWCLLGDPTLPLPDQQKTDGKPVQIMKKPSTSPGPWEESTPFLDLSLTNTFEISGKIKTLQIKLCDYNDYEKGSITTVLEKSTLSEFFQYTLPSFTKTRFAIRFEDAEGFETRYVAFGHHPDDIQLQPPSIFTRLTKGVPFEFTLMIKNVGFHDAKELRIEQSGLSESICLQNLPNLDSFADYPIPVSIDTSQSGHFKWRFSCAMKNQDMDDSDNSVEMDFLISDEPVHRIGVISFNWQGADARVSKTLSLSRLNQYFQEKSLPVDVKALTQHDLEHLKELSISTLVLYKIRSFSDKRILQNIIQFEKDGGSILVMGMFDSQLLSKIGIYHTTDFAIRDGDSSFQSFTVMKSKLKYFSNYSYRLPCFDSFSVYQSALPDCLYDSAFIIGFTEDTLLYLLQNHRWITYSGMISYLDFARSSESFVFLADLLWYCVNQKSISD